MEVYLVYDDIKDKEWIEKMDNRKFYYKFFNMHKKSDISKGFKIKEEWAAKLNPFILIKQDDKPIKCFYSETGENAVSQFLKWKSYE